MGLAKVDVFRMAVARSGGYAKISSDEDASKEASVCRVFWEPALRSTLEDHDWDFARRAKAVALLTEEHSDYAYAYKFPNDCLAPRRIVNPAGTDLTDPKTRIPMETRMNIAGTDRVILTNQEDAELIYTAYTDVVGLFTPGFVDALAWRLAAEITPQLRNSDAVRTSMMNQYFLSIQRAKANNENQNVAPRETGDSDFGDARL